MTKKTLSYLLLALVLLAAVYAFFSFGERRQEPESVSLLSGVDSDKVARVVIEQGSDTAELNRADGKWSVPARGGYPANEQKISSLFFKLFDLTTTQKVPAGGTSLKKLGLDEEGVKAGKTRIRFLDKDGNELGGLFLGQLREAKREGGVPALSGQFIRRLKDEQIYLVGTPITVSASVPEWLDNDLTNVRVNKLRSVLQKKITPAGEEVMFELVRREGENERSFDLVPPAAEGEAVEEAVISQVASGLENLKFADVRAKGDAEVQTLVFDNETVFRSESGLVYAVKTAHVGEKVFLKLAASFDEKLAQETQAKADKANADAEKARKAKEEAEKQAAAAAGASPAPTPSPTPEPAKIVPQLSNSDEAAKTAARYEPWVYQLAQYQADKFRKQRSDLLKKKDAAEKSPEAPAPDALPPPPPVQ